MKRSLFSLFTFTFAGVGLSAFAQSTTPPTDPTLAPIADVPGLPRVLIIGDSVSIGYTLGVRHALEGRANVHRIPENGGSTLHGRAFLKTWLGSGKWDVISFNFGLWDAKLLPEGNDHAEPDVYEKNLRQIVAQLQATGAKLVWVATTPVPDGGFISPTRRFGDVPAYNAVAKKVMTEKGIPIVDLYEVAFPRLAELQLPHDVHFTPEASSLFSARVAAAIFAQLPKR